MDATPRLEPSAPTDTTINYDRVSESNADSITKQAPNNHKESAPSEPPPAYHSLFGGNGHSNSLTLSIEDSMQNQSSNRFRGNSLFGVEEDLNSINRQTHQQQQIDIEQFTLDFMEQHQQQMTTEEMNYVIEQCYRRDSSDGIERFTSHGRERVLCCGEPLCVCGHTTPFCWFVSILIFVACFVGFFCGIFIGR